MRKSLSFLVLLLVGLSGCAIESVSEPEATEEPWTQQFNFGNTYLNTAPVVTHEISTTTSVIRDRLPYGSIPPYELNSFITHINLPSGTSVKPSVRSAAISVQSSGHTTANIFDKMSYIQTITQNGVAYDVFRLEGWYIGSPIIHRDAMNRVVFTAQIEYAENGRTVHTAEKTIQLEVS